EPAHRSVGPNSFGRRYANGRTSSTLRYRPSPAALAVLTLRGAHESVGAIRTGTPIAPMLPARERQPPPRAWASRPFSTTVIAIGSLAGYGARVFLSGVCPKRALNGKPVRS